VNLQEFINLRDKCPFCDTALITRFISDRKQKVRFEEGRFVAVLVMRGMRSCEPDYEVGYSFGLQDNSLSIEFYNEWDMRNHVTNYMIKIFKEFHKNMSSTKFRFIRACGFCYKYELDSELIDIDLKKSTYGPVDVCDESFVFTNITDDGYKFVLLDNHVGDPDPTSELCWWRSSSDCKIEYPIPPHSSVRSGLPLIPFISKEETYERLSNLITFA
jgi:hypothetical protein